MSAPTTSPVTAEYDPEDGVTTATAVIDNGSFGSRSITFETGRLARQAAGSVTVTMGDSMLLSAPLRRVNAPVRHPVTLRIRNLSAGGMMAECSEPVATGEQVVLELRGIGEVTGSVAWCHDGRIGISFDTPIDPRLTRKPVTAPKRTAVPGYAPGRRSLKIS